MSATPTRSRPDSTTRNRPPKVGRRGQRRTRRLCCSCPRGGHVNADTYELKTILTFERRYVVPTFQRDYEWTEDGQWSLLFDDLETVADRLEEARYQAELFGEPLTKAEK